VNKNNGNACGWQRRGNSDDRDLRSLISFHLIAGRLGQSDHHISGRSNTTSSSTLFSLSQAHIKDEEMNRLDVDRQARSFLPPRTFLISGRPLSSSISIIINCLVATMSLLRRHLVCFYCGRRSAKGHPSGTRQWECGSCEAVNHLDEVRDAYDLVYYLPPLSLLTS